MTGVATINTTADEVGTPFFIRLLNMGMVAQSQTGKQKPHTKANNIPNNAFLGNQRCITSVSYTHLVTSSVGSGMYKLVEYKSGEYYKLEAMEDYFKGSPKVKNLNLPIMTDKSSIQQGIISGQLAGSTTSVSAAV